MGGRSKTVGKTGQKRSRGQEVKSEAGDQDTSCPKWLGWLGIRLGEGKGSPVPGRKRFREGGGVRSAGRRHRQTLGGTCPKFL